MTKKIPNKDKFPKFAVLWSQNKKIKKHEQKTLKSF